ncbi:aminotransferase class V-fold PLP-dependent enzyme [Psychromonas sp. MME2]|uniref:aminotransferase class V-fold PLP-dependent enzyme n=1 Tax=Psychromonas sp. MME2 TaxID=3231033 RepID=UPI00339D08BD
MSNRSSSIMSINRRDFLKKTSGLALAGVSAALINDKLQAAPIDDYSGYAHDKHDDKKFWHKVSQEFILDKNTVYLNTGTTGSMPKNVLREYHRNNNIVASNPWDMQNKFSTWPYVTNMVTAIAPGFGADANEIVLSRNTTDGMCTILNGLHFEAGDVILTTHHEHVAAVSPFDVISKRFAVEVVYLEIPVYTDKPISAQQFVDVFKKR